MMKSDLIRLSRFSVIVSMWCSGRNRMFFLCYCFDIRQYLCIALSISEEFTRPAFEWLRAKCICSQLSCHEENYPCKSEWQMRIWNSRYLTNISCGSCDARRRDHEDYTRGPCNGTCDGTVMTSPGGPDLRFHFKANIPRASQDQHLLNVSVPC